MDPSVLSDSLKEFLDHDPHFEVTVADFIERSKQHPIGHPVNANRIEYLLKVKLIFISFSADYLVLATRLAPVACCLLAN